MSDPNPPTEKWVYNHSRLQMEPGVTQRCPRCHGHGSTTQDHGRYCDLCIGDGYMVRSASGWCRRIYDPPEQSVLY